MVLGNDLKNWTYVLSHLLLKKRSMNEIITAEEGKKLNTYMEQ
jgi:hypothetical protein